MTLLKIKTYNSKLVALIFIIAIFTLPYLFYLFHFDKPVSVLLFLTCFFLLQFCIDKWLTYYVDVDISDNGIQSNWHSTISGQVDKIVRWSDIKKWDYVSNNMTGAFIIWTNEGERLSIRVLNFFSKEKSLSQLLQLFKEKVENVNISGPANTIKQNPSFYGTNAAKMLAIFAAFCSIIIIVLMFTRSSRVDSILWLQAILILSTNLAFILVVSSARQKQ